jgi:hypothetical protein
MVGTIICEIGTIICDIGIINVRFYLLEIRYPHGYGRITHITVNLAYMRGIPLLGTIEIY